MGFPTRAKPIKSCSDKKYFEAKDGLFLGTNDR